MDAPLDSTQIVRLLAEPDRRKVIAALILADGDVNTSSIATTAGLTTRATVDAIDRLVTAGLVELNGENVRLNDHLFQLAARSEAPAKPASEHADQPADIARVLDVSFENGKLVQWPSKQSRRLIVLDHLSQNFEIGKHYTEAEVNDILRPFHEDVAMSRRYLVDAEFLDRSGGRYWRCGGTV